ncbi:HAMP domain-containing histidine kinase [Myxococcota bacterium]|nr:HAMP domain-containing histidine kinase [Myxococcota bacterium]
MVDVPRNLLTSDAEPDLQSAPVTWLSKQRLTGEPLLPTKGWIDRRPLFMVPFAIFMIGTLYLAEYPATRLALLIGNFCALEAFVYVGVRRAVCTGQHKVAMSGLAANIGVLFFMMLGVVLSGGIHSPFAVLIPLPIVGPVLFYGRSRQTVVTLLVLVLGILAISVLPEAVRGPIVAEPYGYLLKTGSLLFAVLITVSSLTDLTEAARRSTKQLDDMREDLLQQSLERTRSLESVSARVAHDLKNPLSAVKALAQLLGRSACDERSRERLDVIYREISSMETIITQYLSFTRPLQDLKIERFDLGGVVDSVLAVMEARASEAGVTLARTPGQAFVRADPRRLKEVFLNLVSNAIEATPSGGRVLVEVRPAKEHSEVVVVDDGKGMSPDELARVGTPYFTTRAKGTGLGVVLAKTVVEQHGGKLEYESEKGRGTKAIVRLPIEACCAPGSFPLPDSRGELPATEVSCPFGGALKGSDQGAGLRAIAKLGAQTE